MHTPVLLDIQNITKLFPGVVALDDVSLDVKKGEVHALCGENGAGKSTLMNVLSGNYKPDGGRVIFKEKDTIIANQQEAQQLGISIVYQERSLVGNLSVAENIFAGKQPVNRFGLISAQKLFTQTSELLDELELRDINPKTRVAQLSSAQQQMVEIAKALSQNPELLILDEPTASITETETEVLFRIIRNLKAKGVSIIYISHRMAEIFAIADRVSVLKDGKYQGTHQIKEITVNDIIRLMVGRDLEVQVYESFVQEEVILEVDNLTGERFQNVSFQLRKGEILSLAGLVGAGRTEVARAIIGADPLLDGTIKLNEKIQYIDHPQTAYKQGLGYLPEDRKAQGLFLEMNVAENIVASYLGKVANRGFISSAQQRRIAQEYVQKLAVKTPSLKQKVINLSGGNQQKIILARWLMRNPDVFIVDEPTHGIDVGAKAEIYKILRNLARQGAGILLISSELPEVLTLSDRILVMWNGKVTAELNREEATEQEIMHYASGTKNMFA